MEVVGQIVSAANYFTIALGVLGFFLQGLLLIGAGVWKLSRIEKAILETITVHRKEIDTDIDSRDRNVGESLQGIRQKINEVELYVRDTFVRRDSYHTAMSQLQENASKSDEADQQWKRRIEDKIDRLAERITDHQPQRRTTS